MPSRRYALCFFLIASLVAVPVAGQQMVEKTAEDKPLETAADETKVEDAPPTWTPELAIRYKRLSSTALSPDGAHVAYVVRHPEMEGEESKFVQQIRVAATDGTRDAAYTRAGVSSKDPAFSPDGRHLAFLSKRTEKTRIWMMRTDGGEAQPLTDDENDVGSFRWSPDGHSIAYLMTDPPTEEEEAAKKEKREVVLVDQNYKYAHLYVMPIGADNEGVRESRRLTSGPFHVTTFDWSPDGTSIVFAHRHDPRINTSLIHGDLSVVRVADGEVTPLVTQGGVDVEPRYSPDGRQVTFLSDGVEPQPVGLRDVYVVDAEGGEPVRLALTSDRRSTILGWSADGAEIFVSESRGTTTQLAAIPADGGPVRDLSAVEGVISGASLADDGRHVAFIYEHSEQPPEVHTSPIEGFEPMRLSGVHDDIPKPPMGATELLTWTSFDGQEIEGLLTYPVDYEAETKVPLILQIHGGPAGVFNHRFTGAAATYPTQVFAQRGYAILRPNPRGSTGYGKKFRFTNVRDWGHGDYEDLMSGIDRVIELGLADPDQLYVMGWSYGGYLTSYLVTRTGRFRAASMGAGLANLISMVHTTDMGSYLVAHMGGVEVWEDTAIYEKLSAIYRVARVTTPTQVIHGAEDLRVPTSQGQEFYRALQRRGVPTEMVVYPDTPHGPQQPKYQMDIAQRILAWFVKHSGR